MEKLEIKILNKCYDWKTLRLDDFLITNTPSYWVKFFDSVKQELKDISDVLIKESKNIFPPMERVFRAFSVPLENVSEILLGQDPYHTKGCATGLCFHVPSNKVPNPSLKNIFKELGNPVDLSKFSSHCLMLNTALTVVEGTPESHLELWKPFTHKLLLYIQKNSKKPIDWILLGAKAFEFKLYVKPTDTIHVSSHPSPFSANKPFRTFPAFLGSGIFLKIFKKYLK